MNPLTIVIADSREYLEKVCSELPEAYRIIKSKSVSSLESLISANAPRVLILDLDTVSVDNKFLKRLKADNPDLSILAVSGKKFHPELRESISSYIYACLSKPLDVEELRFWLRSIVQDFSNKGHSP